MKQLARLLAQHHGTNKNGCLETDYSKIPGLNILASTTNGTSGIGTWRKKKVYFYYDYAKKQFVVEN